MFRIVSSTLAVLLASAAASWAENAPPLAFNRDIRPILSENCFYCHGQDPKHREAKLRLDLPEEAMRDLGGYAAIVPGKPSESELIERITTDDADDQMPPAKSNRHLTPAQKETLQRWIAGGATYQKHWAFTPPQRVEPPTVRAAQWPRNPVDRFILARLESEGLSPSPEAPPEIWLRRAGFDLIGLPPEPKEIDAFLADVAARGEAAYEDAADHLLTSERFGERQAIEWLDTARYADTHGFNNDSARSMWRWRDWVIDAFNSNLPYDQFITEQLAGDLLPSPTVEERIATGFGRNHVINSEGGIIEEEYRVEYVADRVRTTSLAWLGLTLECSRCHDHKFDPLTQHDYYRFFAFFNSIPENGEDGRIANAPPVIPAPTRAESAELAEQVTDLAELDKDLAARAAVWKWSDEDHAVITQAISAAQAEAPLKDLTYHLDCDSLEAPKEDWSFPGPKPSLTEGIVGSAWSSTGDAPLAKIPAKKIKFDQPGITIALWLHPAADNPRDVALLSSQDYSGVPAGGEYGKGQELRLVDGEIELRINDRFPAYSVRVVSEGARIIAGEWRQIEVTYSGGKKAANVRMFSEGRELPTRIIADDLSGGNSSPPFLVGADAGKDSPKYHGAIDELRAFSRGLTASETRALFLADALPYALARQEKGAATVAELGWLRDAAMRTNDFDWRETEKRRDDLWKRHLSAQRNFPTVMIMTDLAKPRPTYILTRGQYDAHGEAVEPGAPEALLAPWPEGAPRNRLGLARWLTQPNHPLTSRVVVNRVWAQLFGVGIVKTVEDFGAQGEYPSHPELLDWLARGFVDGGWNVKQLYKTLVLSAAYRQSSAAFAESIARDPENRLLTRGPRLRLPAELIRDEALAISGLLRNHLGGPSVFPYQPEELYKGVVVGADYPGTKWTQSAGDDLYRRSLYTFWKRTVPHPAMITFDAPDREVCTARRSRTNTPLQALTLLNEPGFLEAARRLAGRMIHEGGAGDEARAGYGFRLATGRWPDSNETRVLAKALVHFREDFGADPKSADPFLKVGASPIDATIPPPELAATTAVASMILNLDETITKD